MDRRQARREILRQVGFMEETRDKLEDIERQADGAGETIVASELRRYLEKLSTLLDQMYVWAGSL